MSKTYRLLMDLPDGAKKGDVYVLSIENKNIFINNKWTETDLYLKDWTLKEIQNPAFFEEVVEDMEFKPGQIMPKEQMDFEEIVRLNNVILQLKCELESVKNMRNVDKKCGSCGDYLVLVRGRYPTDDKRYVCPDCLAFRLDQILNIASPDYCQANQAE